MKKAWEPLVRSFSVLSRVQNSLAGDEEAAGAIFDALLASFDGEDKAPELPQNAGDTEDKDTEAWSIREWDMQSFIHDMEAWGEKHLFQLVQRSFALTCKVSFLPFVLILLEVSIFTIV